MSRFPSPFVAPEPLPGLAPQDYVASFNETRFSEEERVAADPRVAALLRRRPTFARQRLQTASLDSAETRAFLHEVRTRGVGIAGAGLMGISIAASFLNAQIHVVTSDPNEGARDSASDRVAAELKELRRVAGTALDDPTAENAFVSDRVAQCFRTTSNLDELASRPVVVESTPEKPRLKAKLYRQLDAAATAPIMLLTNTSSLTIAELAESLPTETEGRPTSASRFAGFHFFHPATRRVPVEIAVGAATSPATISNAVALAHEIRKQPMIVGDSVGFLVNRLLQAFLNEALAALDEGVPAERVEAVSRRLGMKSSPLRIVDEIGVDVSLFSGGSFLKAYPSRVHASSILPGLLRAGRCGRKTQHGFYRYDSRTSWRDDATLDADPATLAQLRAPTLGARVVDVSPDFHDDAALALRMTLAVLFESARLVEEGVIGALREADAGLVLALGAPEAHGGVCYWSLAFGLARLLSAAQEFEVLGARFHAPALLVKLGEELREARGTQAS